jgi:signal transduction histidine kinase
VSAATPEAPVLRRTRRRLILWSGGSTLVVLVVLGAAIYLAAASSLAAAGTAQLQQRFAELASARIPAPVAGTAFDQVMVTSDPSRPGVLIGGELSGTIAVLSMAVPPPGATGERIAVPAGGGVTNVHGGAGTNVTGPIARVDANAGLLVPDATLLADAVAAGEPVVRETTMGTTPVRVLLGTVPVTGLPGAAPMVAMVIGDRTAELDTLRTLLVVLLGGGLAVLVASMAVGSVYAGRALVPIRESLRRQREFAADASHELRTPLAITRAAIAELRLGRTDPATVDRALDDLDAGASRLESLVDDLLLLARADADAVTLTATDTDLAHAVAEAVEALEPVAAARGVRLALDVTPAPVRGDEARLRQLAGILVDNAIRHSPAGGRVTVAVRPGGRLTVEDEGPGIEADHLEHVFERFWRAPDAPAGGTGLGLAIARWIAEHHGGTIHAERREPGPGARFVVRLAGT